MRVKHRPTTMVVAVLGAHHDDGYGDDEVKDSGDEEGEKGDDDDDGDGAPSLSQVTRP